MTEKQTAAAAGPSAGASPADAPPDHTVEAHCDRRDLSAWDRALVRAHARYAVGQIVTDEAFDAALAKARGIALR